MLKFMYLRDHFKYSYIIRRSYHVRSKFLYAVNRYRYSVSYKRAENYPERSQERDNKDEGEENPTSYLIVRIVEEN